MKNFLRLIFTTSLIVITIHLQAKTWQVGPTRTYTKPSTVASLVQNGDTVEIDTGLYLGDCASWTKNNLLLRATSAYAHLDANGHSAGGKAIWVISGNNVRVENIEFSGCTVVDNNGAGIRIEGKGLYVKNCYFHHNENGMLGGSSGSIIVESSEFAYNGFGDGYSHNIYINHADSFTLMYCYMHHAKIGHEVKSRANRNYILYNRIMTEATGTGSRDIDLPNGGLAIIIGNLIQQGPNTQNSTMLGYGLEGLTNTVPHQLYVINNTFVNERGNIGIFINTISTTALLKTYNNLFTGQPYTFLSGSAIAIDTLSNLLLPDPAKTGFKNLSGYNYEILPSSVCLDKGTDPGYTGDFSLTPKYRYIHPMKSGSALVEGTLDVGAYQVGLINPVKKDYSTINTLKYYDFPTENKIMISSDQNTNLSTVMVYDISGKLMDEAVKLSGNSHEWNYSTFRKGVYLIKISTTEGTEVKKFVIR